MSTYQNTAYSAQEVVQTVLAFFKKSSDKPSRAIAFERLGGTRQEYQQVEPQALLTGQDAKDASTPSEGNLEKELQTLLFNNPKPTRLEIVEQPFPDSQIKRIYWVMIRK